LRPSDVAAVVEQAGITFCFAQQFHPAMRHAAVARRDLGIGTAFNFLGPLTNPAQPTYSAVGVADARMAPLMAGVFAGRGKDAAVFRGDDGLDELTISTTSRIWWVRGGVVHEYSVDPAAVGLDRHPVETLRGGDAAYNAQVVRDVFGGQAGPVRDAVVLNAGVALALTLPDRGEGQADFVASLRAGMDRAEVAIDDGSARSVLDRWVKATQR
jgi:anthranilate phosphoribosyltransferase